jgi:hypothetical protein
MKTKKKCHRQINKQFVLCHGTADASGMILWQEASAADHWHEEIQTIFRLTCSL